MGDQEQVVKDITSKIMAEIEPKVSAALKLIGSVLLIGLMLLVGYTDLQAVLMGIFFHQIADDIFIIW